MICKCHGAALRDIGRSKAVTDVWIPGHLHCINISRPQNLLRPRGMKPPCDKNDIKTRLTPYAPPSFTIFLIPAHTHILDILYTSFSAIYPKAFALHLILNDVYDRVTFIHRTYTLASQIQNTATSDPAALKAMIGQRSSISLAHLNLPRRLSPSKFIPGIRGRGGVYMYLRRGL